MHACVQILATHPRLRSTQLYFPSGGKISRNIQQPRVLPSLPVEGEVWLNSLRGDFLGAPHSIE